ncbi:MAG: DGQHR domain-containing protein [Candidatus Nanoarchaeia archaeon]
MKTKILFDNINDDFTNKNYLFLNWLKEKYREKFSKFEDYENSRYQIFYLYFHKKKISDDDKKYCDIIKFVNEKNLDYFKQITEILKFSSKYEIFRFLGLDLAKYKIPTSTEEEHNINTTVILPETSSGFKNIKTVSFLLSAESLIECGYVLRKDNWEDSIEVYQRLLIKNKIKSIREYLIENERGFINNVIVSLPKEVKFHKDGKEVDFSDLTNIESLKLTIPKTINSIGIIDGQHRIFAHYKSNEAIESKISKLRPKLHLLVTGLVFSDDVNDIERIKIESQIFREINDNTKSVSNDVLLHILSLKDPYSSFGIARLLLMRLNSSQIFRDKFEMSTLEKAEIKSTSIIKFALGYIVEINPYKETLFKYWKNQKKEILLDIKNDKFKEVFDEYIDFLERTILEYFSSIRNNFRNDWNLSIKESKILSVTSINGFIIALRKTLKLYGIKDFNFYDNKFKKLNTNFKKDNFRFASSQYNQFSEEIMIECFEEI